MFVIRSANWISFSRSSWRNKAWLRDKKLNILDDFNYFLLLTDY